MTRNRERQLSKTARTAPQKRRVVNAERGELLVLAAVLALFAAAAIGPAISLPFVGDDYVFLDKTRATTFARLWSSASGVDFGWYRPWAREFHFWLLQKLFGLDVVEYRAVGIILWVCDICLYAAVLRRLASRYVAAIAALGVAALALWGTPLLWISGSQDLWMLFFTMLSLLLFLAGRPLWALVPFVFALLSKETSGVLPVLLSAYLFIVARRTLGQVGRQTWPFWATLVTWLVMHPTLRARLLGGLQNTLELEHRPPVFLLLLKTIGAAVNLDRIPHPQEIDAAVVARVLAAGLLLAGGVALAGWRHRADGATVNRRPLAVFAAAWTLIGWAPLFLPSIGWHAYYGCLGVLGLWFGLGLWLQSRPAAAVSVIAAIALLRGAQANSLSQDWGNVGYLRRAGSTLAAIHEDLLHQHATLPPYARVYFANIPSNIGLIAGSSPALRVWYGDSTLQAGFYSYYRPRASAAPSGQDFFFRFDSAVGMVEVKPGPEDVPAGLEANPDWEGDHDGLAALFLEKGDLRMAAVELEKLSRLPHRPNAATYAGACRELLGDTALAESLYGAAQARLHASDHQMQGLIANVRSDVRHRAGEGPWRRQADSPTRETTRRELTGPNAGARGSLQITGSAP